MSLINRTYGATLFWRGTDKAPSADKVDFFAPADLQRSTVIDGKKTVEQYKGFKRKDVSIAIQYQVPEETPEWAIVALERVIHLWAKDIADAFGTVPDTLDTASFLEWATPERSAASGLDSEYVKAGLEALKAFVVAKTLNEARAESTHYVFKNFFSAKAIQAPKGFNAKANQVEKVLEQVAKLLAVFAEDPASNGYEQLIDSWAKALNEEILALTAAAADESLFAL
jgi:hypothetical protein